MARTSEAPTAPGDDLGPRIAAVYAGPLASFVARRDALVKELRSAGRRDEATEVKALRKPRALAWALDAGGAADPDAAAGLAAAVGATGEAQAGGGDVRAAIARLRDAEAALVEAADAGAREHDHPVDRTELAAALRTVVSTPDALADLAAGRLVDTAPAAAEGGLDKAAWTAAPPPADHAAATGTRSTPASGARGGRTGANAGTRSTPASGSRGGRTGAKAGVVGRGRGGRAGAADEGPEPDEVATAGHAVAAAERAVSIATKAADKAATAADRAEDRAQRAERDAAAARRRADQTADDARRARHEAEQRAAGRDDAAEALRRATATLDALDSPGDGT